MHLITIWCYTTSVPSILLVLIGQIISSLPVYMNEYVRNDVISACIIFLKTFFCIGGKRPDKKM
jgi:hypothetical protein